VPEHGRTVSGQMLNEPDGAPPRLAEQSGEPPLALDQLQLAQVVAVMLDQIEGEQHCLMASASAPQRMEVRRPVVAGDHRLAIDADDYEHHAERKRHHTWDPVRPPRAASTR